MPPKKKEIKILANKFNGEKVASPTPKKRLGQHFLIDKNIIRKIVSGAGVEEGELILEIGPGTGALTVELLRCGARVVALEADKTLASTLKERLLELGVGVDNLKIIEGDALRVSYLELSRENKGTFKCVSNLPYNISGPLIAKFFEERAAFSELYLMIQKEVAMRLLGKPSTKDYGGLTVLTNLYTKSSKLFDVSPMCFRPPPKVTSTVIGLRILDKLGADVADEVLFKKVVRGAFGQRRKTLSNALKGAGFSNEAVAEALLDAGIDPGRRGETLELAEFAKLTEALSGN
ncbi:MAG: ribosomal RNA small subunit methyltransferase A [Deltaproteobacteria bacterium]|nr:ribosomal RNA small subunit methyltransferase A [Deltaproteobacteria bacterium]